MNPIDRKIVAGAIAELAAQAQRELFTPIRKRGGYGKRLAARFAAKRLQQSPKDSSRG